MKQLITHRCEESLKAGVSIRRDLKYDLIKVSSDYKSWRLFMFIDDIEYNCISREHVAEINYCPFCGIKLKGLEED